MTTTTTMIQPGPSHPFHDPREWEGPFAPREADERIGAGDLVRVERGATHVVVIAHAQDKDGAWRDATGALVLAAFGRLRPSRFWVVPSPGPEPLPTTVPSIIRDVVDFEGDAAPFLLLGPDGQFHGRFIVQPEEEDEEPAEVSAAAPPEAIARFTDEDGTRWSREDVTSPWTEVAR